MIRDFTAEYHRAIRVQQNDNDPHTYLVYGGATILRLKKEELYVMSHLLTVGGETAFGFTEVRITFKFGLTRILVNGLNGPGIEIRLPKEKINGGSSAELAEHLLDLARQ